MTGPPWANHGGIETATHPAAVAQREVTVVSDPPVLLSSRPEEFEYAARIAPGIEVKLDWEHAATLSSEHTLRDALVDAGLSPGDAISIHLPPGTNRRYGMAVAAGNVGTIAGFTHEAFGDGVDPRWLTLHSARSFRYDEHVERLATLVGLTGYPLAIENTPDRSDLYTPEDLAAVGFLRERADQLASVSLVVDTAHLPPRRRVEVDDDAVSRVLDRMGSQLRARAAAPFRRYLEERLTGADIEGSPADPWRPALLALSMVGGTHVRAVHLNDPVRDGVPDLRDGVPNGLGAVLDYCRRHAIAVVLEPERTRSDRVPAALDWLEQNLC